VRIASFKIAAEVTVALIPARPLAQTLRACTRESV
jgi:hypothetical protein